MLSYIRKHLATIVLALSLAAFVVPTSVAQNQQWIAANQVTFHWDAVNTLADGTQYNFPAGEIKYKVYMIKAEDAADKSRATFFNETENTELVVTFLDEGQYFLGISAARTVNGTFVGESPIGWTDNPDVMRDGIAQGVTFYKLPSAPGTLHF